MIVMTYLKEIPMMPVFNQCFISVSKVFQKFFKSALRMIPKCLSVSVFYSCLFALKSSQLPDHQEGLFKYVITIIQNFLKYVFSIIGNFFKFVITIIRNFLKFVFSIIGNFFKYVITIIRILLKYVFSIIRNFFKYVITIIQKFLKYVFSIIENHLTTD